MGSLLSKNKENPENPPSPPPPVAPVAAEATATGSAGDIDSSQTQQEASESLLVKDEQPASCVETSSEPQHVDAATTPAADGEQQQQQQQEAFDVTTFVTQTDSQQQQQPVITETTETVAPQLQQQQEENQPVAAVDIKIEDAAVCERVADEVQQAPVTESTSAHDLAQSAAEVTHDVQPSSQSDTDHASGDQSSTSVAVDHHPESIPDDVMVSISDLKVDVNSDPTAHCNADEMVSIGISDEHEQKASPPASDDVDVPPPVVGEPPMESEESHREDEEIGQNHEEHVEELVKQTDNLNLEEMVSTSDEIVQP